MRSMSNCAPLGAVNEVLERSTRARSDAQKRLVSSVDVTAPALSPLAQADAALLIENHDGVDVFVGGDVFVGEHHAVAPSRAGHPPPAAVPQPRHPRPHPRTRPRTTPRARMPSRCRFLSQTSGFATESGISVGNTVSGRAR